MRTEYIETVIIGAGQAGLATGYHLQRAGRPFVILDGESHVGDGWRHQWDTLRLFSPAWADSLPGIQKGRAIARRAVTALRGLGLDAGAIRRLVESELAESDEEKYGT
jgi:cation diffusion facilitator CzcD-associated flavoprotein CzcO